MQLTKQDLDAFREICAVGAGHASTALSELTQKAVKVSFPSLESCPIEKIPSLIGKPTEEVATVYLNLQGKKGKQKLSLGEFLLIFPKGEALQFANLLQKQNHTSLNDLDKDSLKETGNILSGACVQAISGFLQITLKESLPYLGMDMLNATLDPLLAKIAYQAEEVLIFKTEFSIDETKIKSNFLLLLNPDIYDFLLKKIKALQQ